ncbi:MAG: efflux RND transporter permease subunit [Acidobacteria bacterium]|nr:efflux RND transporter permease subunit [Acidobacteriota bacterium]
MNEQRGPLAFMAANHVAANILMLFLIIGGAIALWRLPVQVFPDLPTQMITVRVPYLGAAPAEVEEGVCMKVEEAIAGVEGIDRIRSMAQEGMGTVIAELEDGADPRRVLDDIKAAVDRIETFPEQTEKPVIAEVLSRTQVITVVVHGKVPETTIKTLAEQIRDDLTAMDSISQVEISGVRRFEIDIEVSEDTLRRYGLSFAQVADAVRRSSLDVPGGTIKTRGGEILVRGKGQRYRGPGFADIVVLARPDGTRIRLGDIATVVDGFEDSDIASRFDGTPAASVQVFRVGDQGAIEIVDAVKSYLTRLRPHLPAGVRVDTYEDRSEILHSRIDLLLRNGRLGLILVFLSLAIFLDLRLAFWTTMGIPTSFLGAMLVLSHFGVTINMISLFAFIVSLGLVVDDAIVIGENIFAYREQGMAPLQASIRGVREMAVPVIFSVLTTVAAFIPLAYTSGRMGQIMKTIPVVVVSVLLISLCEALFILPSHLARARGRRIPGPIARLQARARNALERFVNGPYAHLLELAVRRRYVTLAAAIATLTIVIGLIAGGHVKFTFMPRVDADFMTAELTMPKGTPLDVTEAYATRIETAARKAAAELETERGEGAPPIIRHIATVIGQQPRAQRVAAGGHSQGVGGDSGGHLAEVTVELLDSEDRGIPSPVLANRWREIVGEIPGASSLAFSSNLFSVGEDINVELSHRDFAVLVRAADRLKAAIREYPGVGDVADSFEPGKVELKIRLKPEGHNLGLSLADLANQVRHAYWGDQAERIQRGRDDIRVKVRYPEAARRTLASLDRLRISLPDGTRIPFPTVAEVTEGRGYSIINRTDRRRVVTVTGTVDEQQANANEINRQIRDKVLPQLVQDFPGLSFRFGGAQREQSKSMKSIGVNFLVAQLAIFALLAIPLRSYVQPLIIMTAIPFGIIGAVLGHLLMGLNLSMLSGMGVVALTGVVVNDSLIMVDLINHERAEHIPLNQVLLDSGIRRFRPILLTTLTTFFGLTPMILERSMQARFLIPMAVSLGFGVMFATAITLVLIPALYRILEDFRGLVGEKGEA